MDAVTPLPQEATTGSDKLTPAFSNTIIIIINYKDREMS